MSGSGTGGAARSALACGRAGAGPAGYRLFLAPGLRREPLGLWLVWFLGSVGHYGAFIWLPGWLRAKGSALPSAYPYGFMLALALLPGYFQAASLAAFSLLPETRGQTPDCPPSAAPSTPCRKRVGVA